MILVSKRFEFNFVLRLHAGRMKLKSVLNRTMRFQIIRQVNSYECDNGPISWIEILFVSISLLIHKSWLIYYNLINGIIDQTHVYHFYTYLSVFWTNGNQCLCNISKAFFLRTLRSEFEIYLDLNNCHQPPGIIRVNKIIPHTRRP